MWTNINTLEIAANVKPGSIIAIDPDLYQKSCIVTSVDSHFVKAINSGKKQQVVILPKDEVISGKWWVEHKLVS